MVTFTLNSGMYLYALVTCDNIILVGVLLECCLVINIIRVHIYSIEDYIFALYIGKYIHNQNLVNQFYNRNCEKYNIKMFYLKKIEKCTSRTVSNKIHIKTS